MLINEAFAQAVGDAGQAEPNALVSLLPLIGILVVFYFLLIRPQTKRAKEQKQMQDGLQKGDEIIITGGELGRVVTTGENYITMEIAPDLVITVLKSSVQTLLPKGTLRSIESGKSNRTLKSNKHKNKAGDSQKNKPKENVAAETESAPTKEAETETPSSETSEQTETKN